jgi:hypothetical protein
MYKVKKSTHPNEQCTYSMPLAARLVVRKKIENEQSVKIVVIVITYK